ncbi:MAG: mechanosensitive ion channel family protein [Chthoniobacteraceae bacterium]
MIALATLTETILTLAVGVIGVYWLTVALGRFLKRQVGVKLGVMYRLFCIAISLWLPLKILHLDYPVSSSSGAPQAFDLQRELSAISILLGAVFAIALIRRYVWEGHFREKQKTEIPKFLQQLAALVIFLIAVMLVLNGIYGEGRALGGLIAGSGIVAVILGFAMQDLLGNIISGIALEIGKPFKRGDWLVYETHRAEVIEVNWRSTRLCTNDHTYLDVPNSQIVRHTVVNLSYPTKRHAERFTIGIDYNVPPNQVKEILKRAACDGFNVLPNPPPKVFLKDFGDSAIIYEIKFWMERDDLYNDVMDSVHTNVWYELNRHGIKIPFPIRTLQIERHQAAAKNIPSTLLPTLRKQQFFQCLDDAGSERLLSTAKMLRYGRSEKIIIQGGEGHSMFVLVKGAADVHVDRNGELTYVASLKAGDYFGEMSLLTGEKRTATVIAKSDCELLEIEKESLAEVLQSNKELFQKLSEMLAQRRLETEGILASTVGGNAAGAKQEEYAANFLERLYSFFQL